MLAEKLGTPGSMRQNYAERISKVELSEANRQFISQLADWKIWLTLTSKGLVSPDGMIKRWRHLLQVLNRRTFGKNYVEKVGHSYFSYAMGIEVQKRDVIHLHVLIDRPIDFDLVHRVWGNMSGFAWMVPVSGNREKVIKYLSKYVSKGGEIMYYLNTKRKSPASPLPSWWR